MKHQQKFAYSGLIALFLLSGCSSYKDSFDCPVGKGMACSSLHRVNTTMDKGDIPLDDTPQDSKPLETQPRIVYGSSFQVRR